MRQVAGSQAKRPFHNTWWWQMALTELVGEHLSAASLPVNGRAEPGLGLINEGCGWLLVGPCSWATNPPPKSNLVPFLGNSCSLKLHTVVLQRMPCFAGGRLWQETTILPSSRALGGDVGLSSFPPGPPPFSSGTVSPGGPPGPAAVRGVRWVAPEASGGRSAAGVTGGGRHFPAAWQPPCCRVGFTWRPCCVTPEITDNSARNNRFLRLHLKVATQYCDYFMQGENRGEGGCISAKNWESNVLVCVSKGATVALQKASSLGVRDLYSVFLKAFSPTETMSKLQGRMWSNKNKWLILVWSWGSCSNQEKTKKSSVSVTFRSRGVEHMYWPGTNCIF